MSLISAIANATPRNRLPAPGVAFSLLGDSADHRASLASLEISEARDHALISTLLAVGTVALGLFTGFAVTLLLASLAWDSPHRIWWLIAICAMYLVGAVATGYALVHRLRNWRPLDETQHQLQEDFRCLSKLIKSVVH